MDVKNFSNCECNEVKVGDKIKIYHLSGIVSGECEVISIMKVYDQFDFHEVPAVIVSYNFENIHGKTVHEELKLQDPKESKPLVYFNMETKEQIKEFTIKPLQCDKFKVGDKIKIKEANNEIIDGEVISITQAYSPSSFQPEVCVMVKYDGLERKLRNPKEGNVQYWNSDTNEEITEFTIKK